MKHDFNITMVILAMFFITQMIGLVVIDAYSPKVVQVEKDGVIVNETVTKEVPYGMEPPELEPEVSWSVVPFIFLSIIIATIIFFILTKLRLSLVIKAWFFFVVMVTMAISLTALFSKLNLGYSSSTLSFFALPVALVMAFFKIIKRNFIVHNLSELLVYPGLAAVFVPFLYQITIPDIPFLAPPVFWTLVLLFAISLYDAYAVWKSKHMVQLAQYQIRDLKIFTGFFLPYLTNRSVEQINKIKKSGRIKMEDVRKKARKIKISLAILGGGDIAFPLIFAGVVMRVSSFLNASIIAVAATLSLLFLFIIAKKEKFYPAMPFLAAGCVLGYLITLLI